MIHHGPPEEIIQKSIDSIEIEPELLTLQRIEETISATKQLRQNKVEKIENNIKNLNKRLTNLTNEIELLNKISDYNFEILNKLGHETISKNDEDDNIFRVLKKKSIELDNLKVSLAKNLNDLESSINSLNLNKNNLIKQLNLLKFKMNNLINSNALANNQDSKILKINLYKNLGIQIENYESEGNKNDQIIIYNKQTDLSSILKVDDKYSDFFITNYIWDRLDGYS